MELRGRGEYHSMLPWRSTSGGSGSQRSNVLSWRKDLEAGKGENGDKSYPIEKKDANSSPKRQENHAIISSDKDQGENMFADKATIQDVNSTTPASDGGSLGGKILVDDQKDALTKKRRVRRDSRKDV